MNVQWLLICRLRNFPAAASAKWYATRYSDLVSVSQILITRVNDTSVLATDRTAPTKLKPVMIVKYRPLFLLSANGERLHDIVSWALDFVAHYPFNLPIAQIKYIKRVHGDEFGLPSKLSRF